MSQPSNKVDRRSISWSVEIPRLDGSVVLVAGGDGAIGAAVVDRCVSLGASVVSLDLAKGHESEVFDSGKESVTMLRADVTNEDEVRGAVKSVIATHGRIDSLINAAGVSHVDPIDQLSVDVWRKVFAVNVEAAFLLTRECLGIMKAQEPLTELGTRGRIVHIGSEAGFRPRPLLAAYGASKAALNHFARSSAVAFEADLIATTVVYPGTVTSGMAGDLLERIAELEGNQALEQRASRNVEAGGHQPESVASVVARIIGSSGMSFNGLAAWSYPRVAPLA